VLRACNVAVFKQELHTLLERRS